MATKKTTTSGKARRRTCGTMAAHLLLLETQRSFRSNQRRLEEATAKRLDTGAVPAKLTLVTIKTVVNVVYRTEAQNISAAQINSQIAALNKDFRATNPDRT